MLAVALSSIGSGKGRGANQEMAAKAPAEAKAEKYAAMAGTRDQPEDAGASGVAEEAKHAEGKSDKKEEVPPDRARERQQNEPLSGHKNAAAPDGQGSQGKEPTLQPGAKAHEAATTARERAGLAR